MSDENNDEVQIKPSEPAGIPVEVRVEEPVRAEVEPPLEEVLDEDEEFPVAVIPLTPRSNITVRKALTKPMKIGNTVNRVSVINMSFKELENKLGQFDARTEKSVAAPEWVAAIEDGLLNFYSDKAFDGALVREGSNWTQGVEFKARFISAGIPQIAARSPGSLLTGDAALLRVRSMSGLGTIVQVPLWHSGIWVKIKAPADDDLMEMERSLSFSKTDYGSSTLGSIFSNESVYLNTIVARFALKYCLDSSLADSTPENLVKVIRATDIPTLVWGLACAIFSNGYPLTRPCVNNPKTCQHIETELLSIGKMDFTDSAALTDWQKEFMLNPDDSHTPDDVLKYQKLMTERHVGAEVEFNENVTIHLGVPSIAEYEASGHRWISSIVAMTEGAATKPLEGNLREQYIADQAKITRLRQYSHWIKELSLSSEERIVDIKTIEDILTSLSSNETWDESEDDPAALLNKITKFIDNVTVSVFGIPRFECPACGALQTEEYNKHPELIVVDVVKFFFTLVSHRLASNISRRL